MRSVDARALAPASLARRLAWTLATSSTIAAGLALAIALPLADLLIREQIEGELAGAAAVLSAELDETPALRDELDEEAHELGIEGRVTLIEVEPDSPASCERIVDAGVREFACRRPLGEDPTHAILVAVPIVRVVGHRLPLLIAGLGVLVAAMIGAAWLGRRLAARVLAPLAELQKAVIDIDAAAPGAIDLPPQTGFVELDALRSAIASLLERLDAELTLSRRFTSAAAHELRTPLTKMLTELELAAEGEGSPATLERLHRTTAHLVALTERLLLLATPREALERDQATSMAALVEALVDRRPTAEVARLRLSTDDADGLVRGDEILLAAMLDNLVDNALGFSTGPVQVRVFERAGEVVIEVDDEGPGVRDDAAAELFLPFHRAAPSQARPGHGLGLALVAHVVRVCGGRVGFVAGRSRGARVEVRLPSPRA